MGKNHNYTNYSKSNKPAETTPAANPDEIVQNLQETENKIDETLIPVGSVGAGTMLNPAASENTEPANNATPDDQTTQPDPEPEDPDAVIGVVVNCEKLNIRAEAKADAKIVGTFFKGQEIEIYLDTSTDDFYDVNVGYCMKKYIKINN